MMRASGQTRIHPALHVTDQKVLVGRVSERGEYQLVSSRGLLAAPDDLKDLLLFAPRPYADLAGRWNDDDVAAFVANPSAPAFSEILALSMHTLDEAMEFPRPEHRALLATWSLASYFHPLFLSFPRLNPSGERESGKSKVLALLHGMAWNALLMLNPTPAVLFRLAQEFKPTLLLDEVEGLNRDDAREVLAIINAGYKSGGTVPRCEGEKTKRVELFAVYAPLALAAIKTLNATTEDRCIPLVLQRGRDRARINREVDVTAEPFARIRAGCYRLLLIRWRDVHAAYTAMSLPTWLNARARELWKPLLAVAAVADRENGLRVTPDLLALAQAHVEDRDPLSAEGEALLAVLAVRLGEAPSVTIRPGELREGLREHLGWQEPPTSELVGAWLRRFGFRRSGKDRVGAKYDIRVDALAAVTTRHTPDVTVTPPPSQAN